MAHVISAAHRRWDEQNPVIAEVCEMWLLGRDNQTIADELKIDQRTVWRHRVIIDDWLRTKFGR